LHKFSKLGGIETLNYNLFLFLKKLNFKVKFSNKIQKKDINTFWDVVISSNESRIFSILNSKKKILWLHNILQVEKAIRKSQLIEFFKHKIIAVFVSDFLKKKTSFFYPFKERFVIDNFLDKNFCNIKKTYLRKPIYIWSTIRKKGLDIFVYNWIKNYSSIKNSEFHIFGVDKKKVLEQLGDIEYSKYKIFIHGFVKKKILIKYYSSGSGFICLGYDETFCLNAVEANSCGLPIFTFGFSNLKNLVINEKNGFIVADYNKLIEKIIYFNNLSDKIKKKYTINSYLQSKKYLPTKPLNKWLQLIK
jgi:glycosyltransferase involved in cell wall biosynthesis